MVARSACNDPPSRFTPVIVTAEPTLFGIVEGLGEFLGALDPRQEPGELRVLAKE